MQAVEGVAIWTAWCHEVYMRVDTQELQELACIECSTVQVMRTACCKLQKYTTLANWRFAQQGFHPACHHICIIM